MWTEILIGLSLMFVIEGFVLAIGPKTCKRAMREIIHMPVNVLRMTGIASMLLGLVMLLIVK